MVFTKQVKVFLDAQKCICQERLDGGNKDMLGSKSPKLINAKEGKVYSNYDICGSAKFELSSIDLDAIRDFTE